jgi:hypothetical protein
MQRWLLLLLIARHIADPTERVRRSGIAPRAIIIDYPTDEWSSSQVAAMQHAVSRGIDVLDFSADFGSCGCGRTCNTAGLNTELTNLRNAGVLWVKSIGNAGSASYCNAGYPGSAVTGSPSPHWTPGTKRRCTIRLPFGLRAARAAWTSASQAKA